MGDFNVCRFTDEKIGGDRLNISKLKDFNDCISSCGLYDVKSIGSTWSWHNNSQGQARIYGKLDRALCNDLWFDTIPEAYIEYRCTSSSYHTPLLLHFKRSTNSGPKPFMFFNHWIHCRVFGKLVMRDLICSSWYQNLKLSNWH